MHPVIRTEPVLWLQVEPFPVAAVPGEVQCLQAPPRKAHQVLLEGKDTKDIGYLEVLHGTLWPLGMDDEAIFFFEKTGTNPLAQQFYP